MIPPRRKKWTEAEEKTLIDKYGEMVADGSLAKMRTREKKFKPVACYVNSLHHLRDPVAYPWQWTWKDVSTKGLTHWSNFLRYKEVFGDVALVVGSLAHGGAAMDGVDNEVMGLGFEYDAEEGEWTAQPAGLSDHTSASNHYLSHMMQNLHHVNGIVHSDTRVEGDNQEDQFIVDG
ncbi:hypothetical protein SESBI_24385 [Sesbania bispinosa]|nr:hypothetical protein SESBI_24385 [Sesbania bispinosa]